jgi:hypothetical protein
MYIVFVPVTILLFLNPRTDIPFPHVPQLSLQYRISREWSGERNSAVDKPDTNNSSSRTFILTSITKTPLFILAE